MLGALAQGGRVIVSSAYDGIYRRQHSVEGLNSTVNDAQLPAIYRKLALVGGAESRQQ